MPHPAQYKTLDRLKDVSKKTKVPSCFEIKDINQRKQLLKENKIVVVYLFAEWCDPCKVVGPMFDELAQQFKSNGHVILVKENVSNEYDTEYKTSVIPAFTFYRNGQLLKKQDGSVVDVVGGNFEEIKNILKNLLSIG
jgi:thioredoxin 1